MLDQKSYVVLSDFSLQQNGESSPLPKVSNDIELEHNADFLEEPDDVNMDEDGEMAEAYSDSSDEDLDSESSSLAPEMEDGDVTNILIGIGDSRMRYKVYSVILLLRCALLQSFTYKFILVKQKKFILSSCWFLILIMICPLCLCIKLYSFWLIIFSPILK